MRKISLLLNNYFIFLVVFILIFILIRSIHFVDFLNFSTDQVTSSIKVLDILRNKKISLIGPPVSFSYQGKYIFHGGASYYLQLIFLALGNFDPVISSYLYMIFSSIMIIPLFFGSKYLVNEKTAWLMVIVYSLLPLYIDYTRFLWNPNFQLTLLPLLILSMGLHKKFNKSIYFFTTSVLCGVLLQLHYQFLPLLLSIFIYYFFVKRLYLIYVLIFLLGLSIGLFNMLLFELRNHFYNIQTVFYILSHSRKGSIGVTSLKNFHYFLSIILLGFLTLGTFTSKKFNILLFLVLLITDIVLYAPTPSHAFGTDKDWNYVAEDKIHKIITTQHIKNYNVANLTYDTLASVQKYLLIRDHVNINFDNYSSNQYLFVVNKDNNYLKNLAYEVNTFTPSQLVSSWKINKSYNLYLLKRL